MKKLFTAIVALVSFSVHAANVKDYGALCNGITDDTQAIQATINANQLIEFPIGRCLITSPLTVNKAVVIQGVSRQLSFLMWTSSISGLMINTADSVDIRRMGFQAPLNATSGNSIQLTAPSTKVNSLSSIKDSAFIGGWNQVYTEAAYVWVLDGNYHYGYVNTGVTVSNTFNGDFGDSTIVNSVMSGGGPSSTSIYQTSSGGLRIINNKLLGGAYAYRLIYNSNQTTGDFIFTSNSVENQTSYALSFATATGTSVPFANIVINDNQFMNQPIVIGMDSGTRFMSRMVINDNSMSVVKNYGIILTNVEDFIVANNQITAAPSAINGIAIGTASQNGKVNGNRTKGFAVGIVNSSASTVVVN
jgi:Pectate lyase superfamily protein